MERRGCGLGCIIAGLGLMLSLCLAPYLISSIYSIASAVLQVPAAPNWLWGDLLNTVVGESDALYMLLAEGPICCVGTIGLLIVMLGLVLTVSSLGQAEESESEEEYASY
jgi:uncharacterized membrane protein